MEAAVPIPLTPPLRPFRAEDAPAVARLNDMASMGLVLHVWTGLVGPDGDPWEHGRKRQIARMESGQTVVVVDQGRGVEAALIGSALAAEPEDPASVEPEFAALVELENLVLGSWYLNVIATMPEARRRGHARRLMAAAEAIARAGGHDRIALVASNANDEALPLYAFSGYTEVARRPMVKGSWDGPGSAWILMAKDLA